MKKRTLCLIFGGKSKEYAVSLRSCACILKHIDREKFELHKIGITENGEWYLFSGDEALIESGEWIYNKEKYPVFLSPNTGELIYERNGRKISLKPDIAFPIVHGDYGEDGRLRGLFDIMGIRCIGCSAEAGAVTFNKHLTKLIALSKGIDVCDFFCINGRQGMNIEDIKEKARGIGYPLFVKAAASGSSIGVYKVKSEEALIPSLEKALEISKTVLIEQEVVGTETEIAILESEGKIRLGKIGQIEHTGDFYDYDTKYGNSEVKLIIPAKIGEECANLIKKQAREIFTATGCRGMCRADFFVTAEGKVVFNELNTVPGFTSGSMYPLLMADDTGEITDLINNICLQM